MCSRVAAGVAEASTCSRSIRTSSGMFFRRGQDEVIKRVEERIAAFSMVPAGAHALRPLATRHGGADFEHGQTTEKASRSFTTRLGRNTRWALLDKTGLLVCASADAFVDDRPILTTFTTS